MLGKTHIAAGIASSLVILQPSTLSGVLCSVAGGAAGGWLCDIDCRSSKISEGAVPGALFTSVITAAALFLDNKIGNGLCDYMRGHWGIVSAAGLLALVICCIYGASTSHRTFMHSFLGAFIITASMYVFCKPLALPVLAGLLSHILLDLPNKRGVQLFYPHRKKFCLNWCTSDGKTDQFLCLLASTIAIIAASVLSIISISNGYGSSAFLESLRKSNNLFGLNYFQWYLIFVNAITFIMFCANHWICTHTDWESAESLERSFINGILNILAIFGGAFGMLLSFIALKKKIKKYVVNWYAVASAMMLVWSVVYCIVCDPFHVGLGSVDNLFGQHKALLIYLAVLNLLSLILFYRNKYKGRLKWTNYETVLFLIGLIGGTLGGLIIIMFSKRRKNLNYFSFGFSVLLSAQVFFIGYLMLIGVV